MSALLMGRVFYASLPGHLKLLLLALADHANDDGTGIHVGQARLARKVGASERAVRTGLATLADLGYIERLEKGGRRGSETRPSTYRVIVDALPSDAEIKGQPEDAAGWPTGSGVPVGTTPTGSSALPNRKQASAEPSVEPSVRTPPESSLASLESSLPPQGGRAQKPPDEIFEALFVLEAGEPYSPEARRRLTRKAAAALNAAAAEVREAGTSADELRAAIAAWPRVMGSATCTAHAVAKHLPRLLAAAKGAVFRAQPEGSIDQIAAEAERLYAERTGERKEAAG